MKDNSDWQEKIPKEYQTFYHDEYGRVYVLCCKCGEKIYGRMHAVGAVCYDCKQKKNRERAKIYKGRKRSEIKVVKLENNCT